LLIFDRPQYQNLKYRNGFVVASTSRMLEIRRSAADEIAAAEEAAVLPAKLLSVSFFIPSMIGKVQITDTISR
jgi:hypothetical protein